jgi:hypothetical protein
MYLSAKLNPFAKPEALSALLDAVDAVQGVIVLFALAAFGIGRMDPRDVGQTIAMALFVAATAHTCDGVLAFKTSTIRWFGRLILGRNARTMAVIKTIFGVTAFLLSFSGIVLFAG